MKNLIIITVILTLSAVSLFGQISNVKTEQKGSYVIITYDLEISGSPEIQVLYSADGGASYGKALKQVSGDVGPNVSPGKGKLIVWDVAKESGINTNGNYDICLMGFIKDALMMGYVNKTPVSQTNTNKRTDKMNQDIKDALNDMIYKEIMGVFNNK